MLRIYKHGEKMLRQKTYPVQNIDQKLKRLIKDMFETMYAANGIGLAANQVGLDIALSVIDIRPDGNSHPMVIINPKIIRYNTVKVTSTEGCLSLPGLAAEIKRYAQITVSALNENGLPVEIKTGGLLARCLQHEIDHLNGRLIIDRVPLLHKAAVWRQLRKLKKEWH